MMERGHSSGPQDSCDYGNPRTSRIPETTSPLRPQDLQIPETSKTHMTSRKPDYSKFITTAISLWLFCQNMLGK